MKSTTLAVSGMHCGSCIGRVTQALQSLPGVAVEEVKVGSARVDIDPARSSQSAVIDALARAGYPASLNAGAASKGSEGGCCHG